MAFSCLSIQIWICVLQIALGVLDNKGTEFLVAFMDNKVLHGHDIKPELFVTTDSRHLVHINISSPGISNSQLRTQFTVSRGQVHLVQIDTSYRLDHTESSQKAILIQSDKDIVVYGVNRESHSDDGYLALPTDALGTEYYTISYSPSYYYTLFTAIGVYNDTSVSIHLPNTPHLNVTLNGHNYHRNQWINLTLNRFSTLEISSVADLTGSHILSDKAVGVLSGNKKAVVGNAGKSRDHLVEMLLPVSSWGKKFVTIPIPERHAGDIFRFLGSEDNTQITVHGLIEGKQFHDQIKIAKAGHYVQKQYSSGLYSHVVSDKPITLFQFSMTQQRGGNDLADPSLITIPPIEQYAARYTFTTPQYSMGNYTNYFMFVVKSSLKHGLRLDHHQLPGNTIYHHIPGTHLVAGYVKVSVGTHSVTNVNHTVVGGILFGMAKLESYGFPVGLLLKPLNSGCQRQKAMEYGDEIDNDCDGDVDEEECDGKDDDGDGHIDEDCRCCAPKISIPNVIVGRRR
ncbi:IgGFc-binding protein-like [Mytilus galloprovincialis]|uniref:IgGFc-binding protein-like n=1 Tax=Mytilus galloprovincialis TaxID=29158 RepID=UPI003F7C684C